MEKNQCIFKKKEKGTTMVCVKTVKQEEPDEWDESMPLPGDIIEGFATEDEDRLFVRVQAKSKLSSQLGKLSQNVNPIWLKVRRGIDTIKIRVNVFPERRSLLQIRFTVKASKDDRHIAVLGDLTLEQCIELQEMSRTIVKAKRLSFSKKGVKYDWKMKLDNCSSDQQSSVVSSILFLPIQGEFCIDATSARCMAWFSAAVSSGVPLVFINIQTEQTVISEKEHCIGKEPIWGRQQNYSVSVQILQGVRLWFLPGIAQVVIEMTLELGEDRIGIDIKRTDEGFICVDAVAKDSAADRAGIGSLYEEAKGSGHLLVISKLQGKSLMPSSGCSVGLLHCCDKNEIKGSLASAIEEMDPIQFHFMAWQNQTHPTYNKGVVAAALQTPKGDVDKFVH